MRRACEVSLVVSVALCLGACNNHLSRSNAKAQIEAGLKHMLPPGTEHSTAATFNIGSAVSGICHNLKDYDPVGTNGEYPALAAAGFIITKPIKKDVWSVELTDKGKKSIDGEPYGHRTGIDCDQWQVTMPLSRFDHIEVTGIVEDGVHAKVDVDSTFTILQAGFDLKPIAEKYIREAQSKTIRPKFLGDSTSSELHSFIGDIADTEPSANFFVKHGSVSFTKYDDGWKLDKPAKE
jgi:hypothetical protein